MAVMTGEKQTITRKDNSHPAAYALEHVVSEMTYVGSTENLYQRVSQHKNALIEGNHKNKNLQKAFNEDPRFNLTFTKTETKEEAVVIEQKTLNENFQTGKLLNISPDARVPCKGISRSEEQKEKLRQITLQQFSTEEARQAQSERSKKLWQDPNFRERYQEGRTKIDKQAAAEKLSTAIKNKWSDPEYVQKQQDSRSKVDMEKKGEKISLANKQKWAEPGFREMMIERRKKK